MKRALSRAFDPPAPMVPVHLRAPDGLDTAEVEAKVDTGADLCAVPERLIAELDLPPVREVRAAGFAGVLQQVPVYRVDILLDGDWLKQIEALATRRAYAILGRNVLRHFVIRIDGPKGQLEIKRPRR